MPSVTRLLVLHGNTTTSQREVIQCHKEKSLFATPDRLTSESQSSSQRRVCEIHIGTGLGWITEITSGEVYLSTSSWKLDYITVQNRMLRFDLSKNPHLHKSLYFPARSKLGITYQGAQLSCTHSPCTVFPR